MKMCLKIFCAIIFMILGNIKLEFWHKTTYFKIPLDKK